MPPTIKNKMIDDEKLKNLEAQMQTSAEGLLLIAQVRALQKKYATLDNNPYWWKPQAAPKS